MRSLILSFFAFFYRLLIKRLFFLFDPFLVHEFMLKAGEKVSNSAFLLKLFSFFLAKRYKNLEQKACGLKFSLPVGLAAGYDYEAKIPGLLSSFGFGFQSVGTITYGAYMGNNPPLLGRLPKSKSLMVNKGFKNPGARAIVQKIKDKNFSLPVGISIGRTNNHADLSFSIEDIKQCFKAFEQAHLRHSYYELNISCPNLLSDVSFYPARNLEKLLSMLDLLKLKRPIFVKMPLEKNDKDFLDMLKIIARHSPAGIIIGNLQKNRLYPALLPSEVAKFPVGNFSGKPTFKRSNELIRLTYLNFKERFVIIGCGGIFSAEDAYQKIKAGATLLQLITGMIFEGPQLVAQINSELSKILKEDGHANIAAAIGADCSPQELDKKQKANINTK